MFNKKKKEKTAPPKRDNDLAEELNWFERFAFNLRHQVIFIRSGLLIVLSFLLVSTFAIGTYAGLQTTTQKAKAVTPVDSNLDWTNSNATYVLKKAYKGKDSFIIPFEIDDTSLKSMPYSASNYSIRLINTKSNKVPTDWKARFILYGNTGYAAVAIQGKPVDGQFNLLITNNKIINQRVDDESGKKIKGELNLNGTTLKVNQDILQLTFNPSVATKAKDQSSNPSPKEVLNQIYGQPGIKKFDAANFKLETKLKSLKAQLAQAKIREKNQNANHQDVIDDVNSGNVEATGADTSSDSNEVDDDNANSTQSSEDLTGQIAAIEQSLIQLKQGRKDFKAALKDTIKRATVSDKFSIINQ